MLSRRILHAPHCGCESGGAISLSLVKKIKVKLRSSAYDVLIGGESLRIAGREILRALGAKPSLCMVVTTTRVRKHWGRVLEQSLRAAGLRWVVIEIKDGESHKNFGAVESLMRDFAKRGADRGSIVVALGGGVVGDIAGFAASIYMRGIPVVQIPTTLLAQVDASIGGKTGVNLAAGKNLVGTFHQPRLVMIDPQVLSTLPNRDYRAGLFEVIKCGVIRDAKLFKFIEDHHEQISSRDSKAMLRIITSAVKVKAEIVAKDEREGGLRRILNFGHTIGHALEADSAYKRFLHGEAVGWGMLAAAEIGVLAGVTPRKLADRISDVVEAYGPLPSVKSTAQDIMRLIRSDKKARNGVPHFVLVTKIGRTLIANDVPNAVVKKAVERLRNLSSGRLPVR
jgi:3-dehydroquinate synthase